MGSEKHQRVGPLADTGSEGEGYNGRQRSVAARVPRYVMQKHRETLEGPALAAY